MKGPTQERSHSSAQIATRASQHKVIWRHKPKIPKRSGTPLRNSQEPDNIRGGFDNHQSFLGDLSELNIWNYTLSEVDIMKMATCKIWLKGNIVSWEKSNLILKNVVLTDLLDPPTLCLKHHQYVIFPEKVPYPEAMGICEIHGGSLAAPKSEEENNKIIHIVFKHKKACIEKEKLETLVPNHFPH